MDLRERSDNVNRHPWELSRTRCMLKEIRALKRVEKVLDIGCGDGYFDRVLIQEDSRVVSLMGVDLYLETPCAEGNCIWTNRLEDAPDASFDLILMMDVLEHIEDDAEFLRLVCRKLKPDGNVLITVPAFQRLFSLHDEELRHFRRYNRITLRNTVEQAGCRVLSESYFYFSLILLRILTRNKTENLGNWRYKRGHFATEAIRYILNVDYDTLRLLSRVHLYLGGLSLFMLVRKDKND